jgi:hypothetical protein
MNHKTYYLALDTEYVRLTSTQNQLLSWQASISQDGETLEEGYIRYIEKDEPRPKLHEIVLQAFNRIGITPDALDGAHIVIICHYCPAEISMLSDNYGLEKIKDIKYLTLNMEYVRKTVISLHANHKVMNVKYRDKEDISRECSWSYEFFDTKLIAPAGASSLDALSKTLDDQSLYKKPMNNYEISHMDWVLKHKKEKFTEYAINDAKATLAVFIALQKSFRDLEGSKNYKIKKTIGSAAVSYYTKFIQNIDKTLLNKILGKKSTLKKATENKFSECYHGGRNETFFIGKAPDEYIYFDIDYKNAYPTCLSMLNSIDWNATPTFITNIKQLLLKDDSQLNNTYVQATFEFPEETKYPCLPDFHEKYGLIYPLEGTTYTTAHEIILAHKMGAIVNIIEAKELQPFKIAGEIYHPFKDFYKVILKEREKYPKKSMKNLLYKEYANTIYGKICQNVSKKKVTGLYSDVSKELGPSPITSNAFAANVTGIMRAALGEIMYCCVQLNDIHGKDTYLPLNAVTDGAMIGIKKSIFSAETLNKIESKTFTTIDEILPDFINKLEESKLIQLIKKTRHDITDGDSTYLEIKSISNKIWTFKTRGSVGYYDDKLTVLTKAGHRPPMIDDIYKEEFTDANEKRIYEHKYQRPRTDDESAKWLLDTYYSLPEIQTYDFSRLISFKDLVNDHNDYEDMINIMNDRKTNLDFDYKRKPDFENEPLNENEEITELTNINTIPFYNKDEMLVWRTAAENTRDSGKKDHVGGKYAGYRATPVKVHQKVFSAETIRFGEKGDKGVIVNYVVHAYIKDKLTPFRCEYNDNQIAKKFLDEKFATKNKKLPFINREMIRTLRKKTFVPTKLVDNNYTRLWVKKTLRQLDINPHDSILAKLIAIRR